MCQLEGGPTDDITGPFRLPTEPCEEQIYVAGCQPQREILYAMFLFIGCWLSDLSDK